MLGAPSPEFGVAWVPSDGIQTVLIMSPPRATLQEPWLRLEILCSGRASDCVGHLLRRFPAIQYHLVAQNQLLVIVKWDSGC